MQVPVIRHVGRQLALSTASCTGYDKYFCGILLCVRAVRTALKTVRKCHSARPFCAEEWRRGDFFYEGGTLGLQRVFEGCVL